MFDSLNTKYGVKVTSNFKKKYKKVMKQGKDRQKFIEVLTKLANAEELDAKYQNHKLNDNKKYQNCNELHIEPDWLLVYKYQHDELILLLVDTGSHSNLF